MTIIGEEGGGFFFVLWSAYFYVLIPFISAIKTHLFVTCATVRIRAGQFNFGQPVSECQNLTCSEAKFPNIMMQKVLIDNSRGQHLQCCLKTAYQWIISMSMT